MSPREPSGSGPPLLPASPLSSWRPYAVLIAAVLCVYLQSLRFGFVNYDDDELIYHNGAYLAQWGNAASAFTTHAFASAGGESVYYRPLLIAMYVVEYHLWGASPAGFHAVNILLHALAVIVLFRALRSILGDFPALAAGLVAALHPLQTEAVGWVAGGNDVLLGLFVALMFAAHFRGARLLSVLWFLCALLTKESAAFYILLLPLADGAGLTPAVRTVPASAGTVPEASPGAAASAGTVPEASPGAALPGGRSTVTDAPSRGGLPSGLAARYLPHALILAAYLALRLKIFGALIGAERLYGSRALGERLADIPAVVAEHLRLIIAPMHLSVAHPIADVVWLRSPLWNIAAVAVTLVFAFECIAAWRRDKILGFGLAWVAVGLLPVLGIFPLAVPILEHRLYLPLFGAAIACGRGIALLGARPFVRPLVVTGAIILAVASFVRLPVWKNGITLFDDAVGKAPGDARSYYSLATAFSEAQRYPEAAATLKEFLKISPDDVRGESFLREVWYLSGKMNEAIAISELMIAQDPRNARRWLETGGLFEDARRPDSAAAYYRGGIALDPLIPDLHLRLGAVLAQAADTASAAKSYGRACDLGALDGCYALAMIRARSGNDTDAIALLEKPGERRTHEMTELLRTLYERRGDLLKAAALK